MKLAGAAMSPFAVKEGGLGMVRRGGARLGMAVNINTGGQYGI